MSGVGSSTSTHGSAVLTVGEVAERAGVTPSAVRFYERHGLIDSERSYGNQRRFTDSAACRILVAKVAQQVGLTVREIAELFVALPVEPTPEDWRVIATALIVDARTRIARLETTLQEIASGRMLCELPSRSQRR
ncbi:MerR family transcriptional regulator [Microbacterium sp. NPDC089698]|uniref:MerR family transcriptional regulator n=1 Tax=Microbacterium sp. NPDC089698 TaxID=3364200 RepID=UPI0038191E53